MLGVRLMGKIVMKSGEKFMIQDIYPHVLKNEFEDKTEPENQDIIMIFKGEKVLVRENSDDTCENYNYNKEMPFLIFEELKLQKIEKQYTFRFLLKIDEKNVFLGTPKIMMGTGSTMKDAKNEESEVNGFSYVSIQTFRTMEPMEMAYAGITAFHLYQWYESHRFCGRCGGKMEHSHKERMLFCQDCKNVVYPTIAPSVIVGVINGDKILVTRYAAGRYYRKYALVAGFTEIGETAERTVEREVMEETGLRVKNIRYYKSQPWGFSGGILLGYWADLDGDDTIRLDETELCEGRWMTREELELDSAAISLTREMMKYFKETKNI